MSKEPRREEIISQEYLLCEVSACGIVHGPEWSATGRMHHFHVLHRIFDEKRILLSPFLNAFSFFWQIEGSLGRLEKSDLQHRSSYRVKDRSAYVQVAFRSHELELSDKEFSMRIAEVYRSGWEAFCKYAKRKKIILDRTVMDQYMDECFDRYFAMNVVNTVSFQTKDIHRILDEQAERRRAGSID